MNADPNELHADVRSAMDRIAGPVSDEHPTPDAIEDFVLKRGPSPRRISVGRHLPSCERCTLLAADFTAAHDAAARFEAPTSSLRLVRSRVWKQLAVAAAVVLILAIGLTKPWIRDEPGLVVAALWSHAGAAEYQASLGLNDLQPPSTLRGTERTNTTSQHFVERATERELEEATEALAESGPMVEAGYFRVVVDLDEQAHALVISIHGTQSELLYPRDEPGALAPLQAGTHVLPRLAYELGSATDPELPADYDPGFLVPLGVERLGVFIGVREARLSRGERQALEQLLQRAATEDVAQWLETAGFTHQRIEVLGID